MRIGGVPLSPWALVSRPAPIDGVLSWTITTRTGRGSVNHVGYSPDGRWLAATNDDDVVRLFDPGTGRLDRALLGHFGAVRALAWSSDKTHPLLATADAHEVRVWDPASGRLVRVLAVAPVALSWSPDGKTLVCATGNQVALWDVEAGRAVLKIGDSPRNLDAVAWSPDGKYVAGGDQTGALQLWKAPDWSASSFKEDSPIRALSWAPDSSAVAVACDNGMVHRQPIDGSPPPPPIKARDGRVYAVAWSPDGKYLATVGDKADYIGRVFDAKTGDLLATVPGYCWFANAVAWAPDGKTLAIGDWDRAVHFYDPVASKWTGHINGHDDIPFHVVFSPSGTTFATDGQTVRFSLWNTATGAQLQHFTSAVGGYADAMAWSPDGARLAGAIGQHLYIWRLAGGTPTELGVNAGAAHMAWSPDGTLLATGQGFQVHLWRTDGQGELPLQTAHKKPVVALAWTADGKTLASGDDGGVTILWDRDGDSWKPRTLDGRQGKVRA